MRNAHAHVCLRAPCVAALVFVCAIGALACTLVQLDRERGETGSLAIAAAPRRHDRPPLSTTPLPVCRSLLILSGRFPSADAVDQLTSSDVRRQAALVVRLNSIRGESSSAWMKRFASAAPPSARLLLARGRMASTSRVPLALDEVYAATRVELERDLAVGALLRSVTGPQNPASLAIAAGFAGLLLSVVFILSKERADGQPMSLMRRLSLTGLFLFPALIWLISAPLVSVIETNIRVFLLTKVTILVFSIFDILGYELERQGNVLILPEGQVGVEEACSGIRSLTACLFAGSFLASVFLDRIWKKVLLVCAAMCFAVLTNLIRSLFLTLWAYHNGSQAIDDHWTLPLFGDIGSVHDVTGFAILGLTCIGLLFLLPIFNYKMKDFDDG